MFEFVPIIEIRECLIVFNYVYEAQDSSQHLLYCLLGVCIELGWVIKQSIFQAPNREILHARILAFCKNHYAISHPELGAMFVESPK